MLALELTSEREREKKKEKIKGGTGRVRERERGGEIGNRGRAKVEERWVSEVGQGESE